MAQKGRRRWDELGQLWHADRNHVLLILVMYGSVLAAFTVASYGFVSTTGAERFTLGVESFALLAASIAIFYERHYQAREKCGIALRALAGEASENAEVLATGYASPNSTYPRVITSAADGAISSGVLYEGPRAAQAIIEHVASWRAKADLFNHRLDIHELVMLLRASTEDIRQMHERMLAEKAGLEVELENLTSRVADVGAALLSESRQRLRST